MHVVVLAVAAALQATWHIALAGEEKKLLNINITAGNWVASTSTGRNLLVMATCMYADYNTYRGLKQENASKKKGLMGTALST